MLSQVMKEKQMKTTIRYHLTPVNMTIINKLTNIIEGLKKRETYTTVCGKVNWYNHCGKQMKVQKITKYRTTI